MDVRFDQTDPPREFRVGAAGEITIRDCGRVSLDPDEQITLVTESGGEYDVARKDWGFYATPSLNGRLGRFGLRGVMVRNVRNQYFVLLVEAGCEDRFERYVASERLAIIAWLDTTDALARLGDALTEA